MRFSDLRSAASENDGARTHRNVNAILRRTPTALGRFLTACQLSARKGEAGLFKKIMFFILSKVIWFIASPVNLAIGGLVLASLLAFTRFSGPGRWLGLVCVMVLGLLAFSPLPRIVVRPLEDRFPQQAVNSGKVDGIIVLGGAIGVAREDIVLNNAAARMFKALGDPVRLRLFSAVASHEGGEACVCDISDVGVSQPTVSHHLKKLKEAGLLTSERRGTWVYYRVEPSVLAAMGSLLVGPSTAA